VTEQFVPAMNTAALTKIWRRQTDVTPQNAVPVGARWHLEFAME